MFVIHAVESDFVDSCPPFLSGYVPALIVIIFCVLFMTLTNKELSLFSSSVEFRVLRRPIDFDHYPEMHDKLEEESSK